MPRWDEGLVSQAPDLKITKIVALDSSGSMAGDKYENAKNAIIKAVATEKEFNSTIFIEFSNFVKVHKENELAFIPEFNSTNLNGVFPEIDKIVRDKSKRYLVQIFTDGEDNLEEISDAEVAKYVEKWVEEGITVTFMATQKDAKYIERKYRIPSSNILAYENTGEGVAEAFEMYRTATKRYVIAVSKGGNVTKGFFNPENAK